MAPRFHFPTCNCLNCTGHGQNNNGNNDNSNTAPPPASDHQEGTDAAITSDNKQASPAQEVNSSPATARGWSYAEAIHAICDNFPTYQQRRRVDILRRNPANARKTRQGAPEHKHVKDIMVLGAEKLLEFFSRLSRHTTLEQAAALKTCTAEIQFFRALGTFPEHPCKQITCGGFAMSAQPNFE